MSTITAQVTTTVSAIPLLRHRDTVVVFPADQDDFVAKYEATNDHLSGTTVAELNAVGNEIDIVTGQINTVAGEVDTNAGIATTKATLATDYAEKMALEVETGTYSSKEHAIGDLTTTGGSAKAWAIDTASPDGTTAKSAKTWAGEAVASASAAYNAQLAAEATYDVFDDRELGAKATAPTVDNDGNALLEGAQYWNSTSKKKFIWNGTAWADLTVNPSAHGSLTGLTNDDHTQYHNDTRGDIRYYTKAQAQALLVSGTNIKTINGGSVLGAGDITITSMGAGGTVTTVPLTLTSASTAQQSLTASAYNQAVTLPSATTLSEGVNVFGLYNNSPYAILVKDNGGNLLGFIASNTQVNCSLADNTTANGTWNLSGETLADIIGQSEVGIGVASLSIQNTKSILIDTNKYLILCSVNNANLVGVVYDAVNGIFGAATLIRAANITYFVNALQVSAGVALVVSCASGSTAFQAVVITVTGTTISIGATSNLTLAGSILGIQYSASFIQLTKVGTSYIAGYARDTTVAEIVAMTVSGTTVTIGTPQAQAGTSVVPFIYDMGSNVAMVLSQTDLSLVYARPVTVSGVTLTSGTQVSIGTGTFVTGFSCRKLDSGRIAIVYMTTTGLYGGIVSLSGTVATASVVQLGAINLLIMSRFSIHKVGNQVIVACGSTTADLNTINILTDNAGTAVAGTNIPITLSSTAGMLYLGSTATALYTIIYTKINPTVANILKITISGNNPIVTTIGTITNDSTSALSYAIPSYGQGLYDGEKYGREYLNGSTFKTFIGLANTTGIFGVKNDGIITMQRPLYITNSSDIAFGANPVDDILIMTGFSSKTNTINIQVAKAV